MPKPVRRRYRSRRQKSAGFPPFGNPQSDLTALWALRILLDLNGVSRFDEQVFLTQSTVRQAAGLDTAPTPDLEPADLRDLLLSRQKEVEALRPRLSGTMASNLRLLAECLSLSDIDTEILAFAVSLHTCEPLADIANMLGELDAVRVISALGVILGLPLDQFVREGERSRTMELNQPR